MEDLRINNKLQRVFVLKRSEESVVYIPVKALTRVDYDRLVGIEKKGGEMLAQMRKETLDNGRNALALYDRVIQVLRLKDDKTGTRLPKPDEPQASIQPQNDSTATTPPPAQTQGETNTDPSPKKRGRGRPPKNSNSSE